MLGTYFGSTAHVSDYYIPGNGTSIQDVFPAEVFANGTALVDFTSDDGVKQDEHNTYNKSLQTIPVAKTKHLALFVAKVLVGRYTQGSNKIRKPPAPYDSCVDRVDNPSKFVIFEKHQIYPAYIIEYRRRFSVW